MELFFSVLKMIIFLIVIIYAINWTLKYLNRYTNQSSEVIEVIQRLGVSKSSSIAIVKILDQHYLMSLSETQNQIIKILTAEEVTAYEATFKPTTEPIVPEAFSSLLKKSMDQLTKKKEEHKHENLKK
ncbi:MAG TPA: flagellar biosynthetic protein FliO [Candidatus Enterococcus avicola]|uniref:Flagellar biosynthetic protein FliO n=1 Tax=Candidatus Enterococcus avicola TaxID=2838561 RepID=A0A9D2F6Y4_9ENTE|nr:flagellar biosynthetic protein FliO [Candidatus Enterococcus avicola]